MKLTIPLIRILYYSTCGISVINLINNPEWFSFVFVLFLFVGLFFCEFSLNEIRNNELNKDSNKKLITNKKEEEVDKRVLFNKIGWRQICRDCFKINSFYSNYCGSCGNDLIRYSAGIINLSDKRNIENTIHMYKRVYEQDLTAKVIAETSKHNLKYSKKSLTKDES